MNVRFAARAVLLAAWAASIPSPASAQLSLGHLVVSVRAPGAGATVSGTVPFEASVTIVGSLTVRNVEFKVNGVKIAEDTAAPYSTAWNTRMVGNGAHRLTACARDLLGVLYESEVVSVTVFNDVTPPAVAITAPTGGTVSGDVTVAADASDNVAVAGVQFTLDGVALGAEDTASPYSIPWNTASASGGAHTLRAIARDTGGNVTTSAAVTVTVDSAPPVVSITAPGGGATVGAAVTIAADASDESGIAGVQFFIDGSRLGEEDTSAPYSAEWNTSSAADGLHSITAVARDGAGKTAESAAVQVRVDNTPPLVAMTSPASGATVSGAITIAADASDSSGIAAVQFVVDGANFGPEDAAAPYSITWDTTAVSDGSHTITAIARDGSGRTTTAAAVSVRVSNVTETLVRIQETDASIAYTGSWSQGNTAKAWSGGTAALATGGAAATGTQTRATLTFTGTAVKWVGFRGPQTGIARVHLDGTLVATIDTYAAAEAVGAVIYEVNGLTAATHTLAVEVTGTKNPASSDIYVVVDAFDVTATNQTDGTAPTVAMTSPAATTSVSGVVSVQADASDNVGVAVVQFWRDGSTLLGEDTTAPYAVDWNTAGVSDGSHSVHATARDAAGNTTTSAVVTVTVANGAPPPPSGTTFTRFENTSVSINFTPGTSAPGRPGLWWHGSRSRGWSNQTASFNRSAGGRATFRFNGREARWIGFRAPWAGIANVYVDGTFIREIDLYSTTEQAQAVIFSTGELPAGDHLLTVEATGRKRGGDSCHIDPATGQPFNPMPADCSTDWPVVVDAFDITPPPAVPVTAPRVEETDGSVQFTASWNQAPTAGKSWSAGAAMVSETPGESVTFTFVGTSVAWIGLTGGGSAQVFLDGALQANIDTASPLENHAVIYRATNLAPAKHELKIVCGTGRIYVDAFDVGSVFEDGHASVVYAGTWVHDNQDRAWSGESPNTGGGTASYSATTDATATFTFTGSEVRWIGYRGPLGGIADVSIDGGAPTRVDSYGPAEMLRTMLFQQTGLADTTHTLTIRVSGERNSSATNALVIIDAFEVKLPATLKQTDRYQETHASVTYSGEWQQPNPMPYRSGGGIKGSDKAGARATVTFTGTGVRWVGRRFTDTGVARVYLNGALVGTIDTRASVQEEFQAEIFNATGLPAATHTLTIEVVGPNGEAAGATVAPVWIDAFDIYR